MSAQVIAFPELVRTAPERRQAPGIVVILPVVRIDRGNTIDFASGRRRRRMRGSSNEDAGPTRPEARGIEPSPRSSLSDEGAS